MMEDRELSGYMASSVKKLISRRIKGSIPDPKGMMFLVGFGLSVRKADRIRRRHESSGEHIPAFLISSITTSCNLSCKGCYARSNGICGVPLKETMSVDDWKSVFIQAEELGISFNILAGGEPLMRRDVIRAASEMKHTVFPVFTNGTLIDGEYTEMFRKNRNIIPVLSLEGNRETTDERRGHGVYDTVSDKLAQLKSNKIFYGVSLTLTERNMTETVDDAFIRMLRDLGCGIVFFLEFVPSGADSEDLVPSNDSRAVFGRELTRLRSEYKDVIFMSFPGDEKYLGGCLGAGRGFFHINPYGDAEACPASPYSDVNIMNGSLKDAISSELFRSLRDEGIMAEDHAGGCVLIGKEAVIQEIIAGRKS